MLRLWNKFKEVIEENEREHQRIIEIRDPEETTIISINPRDFLLQYDHLLIFEEKLHMYLIKVDSFKGVESELNAMLAPLSNNLEEEVKTDVIPLNFDGSNSLLLTKDFDLDSQPFHYFLTHHGIELETRLSAIEVGYFYKKNEIKTTMLNDLKCEELPYIIVDSHPVMPSTLTMFLKYAIRHLDESKLTFCDNSEFVFWERNFQTMALMFDFIRQHRDYRQQVVGLIINHCNDFYKVPRDIAAALIVHVSERKHPYVSSDFKIELDFFPNDTSVSALAASLSVLYF